MCAYVSCRRGISGENFSGRSVFDEELSLGGSVLDFEVVEASKVDYTDTESSALKA